GRLGRLDLAVDDRVGGGQEPAQLGAHHLEGAVHRGRGQSLGGGAGGGLDVLVEPPRDRGGLAVQRDQVGQVGRLRDGAGADGAHVGQAPGGQHEVGQVGGDRLVQVVGVGLGVVGQ